MSKIRTLSAAVAATAIALAGTSTALAKGGAEVRLQDRCDQASFDAVVGPGTCAPVIDDPVTFAEFAAELNPVDFGHDKWRFSAEHLDVRPGATIHLRNDGGEFHTFSRVAAFGGGCVPPLNIPLGLTTAPECEAVGANGAPAWLAAVLVPGASRDVSAPTQPGTYNYMCLIHSWMRTTVTVRR
jgi:plastocyanin